MTTADRSLAGWYVISLRPRGEHAAVRRAAAAHGATVFALSSLALQSLPSPDLDAALHAAKVIVTSPAAARFAAVQRALRPRRGQHWLCVGPGTARSLQRLGIGTPIWPRGRHDSEGLLALAELQDLRGIEIGLLTAPGGRGLIADVLRDRGAAVRVAEVYRRAPLALTPSRRRALAALPAQRALLVSSGEAFDALWQQLDPPQAQRLRETSTVVSSARLGDKLTALGFVHCRQAGSAEPARMLAALAFR